MFDFYSSRTLNRLRVASRILRSDLRLNDELHGHLLVALAANHRANDDVFAWLARSGQMEFLRTRLEQEVPPGNQFPVRRSQQRKSMHRTIPIVVFGLDGLNAQGEFLARLGGYRGLLLTLDFVPAVVIRQYLNHPRWHLAEDRWFEAKTNGDRRCEEAPAHSRRCWRQS